MKIQIVRIRKGLSLRGWEVYLSWGKTDYKCEEEKEIKESKQVAEAINHLIHKK